MLKEVLKEVSIDTGVVTRIVWRIAGEGEHFFLTLKQRLTLLVPFLLVEPLHLLIENPQVSSGIVTILDRLLPVAG